MTRPILYLLAAWFAALAFWMLISPAGFHATAPGAADTGPLNVHFTRDVGLAFLLSGLGLSVGARLGDRRIALFGAGFPLLHSGLHVIEFVGHGAQGHHGNPGDLAGIVVPALAAFVAALCLPGAIRGRVA